MERRRFLKGEYNHIYQRTLLGNNIFYDVEDYLVYYTIFSVLSRKYRIVSLGLCLMIDHIHSLVYAESKETLSRFVSHVTLQFVKEYNCVYGRRGPLFDRFGSAPKKGMKLLRTAVSYLYNNPVEKLLCRYAQDYKWNFINASCLPSYKMLSGGRSKAFVKAVKEIDYIAVRGIYLNYQVLRRLMRGMTAEEKSTLADYVIRRYSFIRYDLLSDCYGGWDNMLMAVNSNAGSEYDMNEPRGSRSDVEYREIYVYLKNHGFQHPGDVIVLPEKTKVLLANDLLKNTSATRYQIGKYLHLPEFFSK